MKYVKVIRVIRVLVIVFLMFLFMFILSSINKQYKIDNDNIVMPNNIITNELQTTDKLEDKEEQEKEQEKEKNINNEELIEEPKDPEEITIYDLEEGYLTVPFNKLANKNNYNWNEKLKKDGYYYKYEDDNYTSKLGIDVSTFQQKIDWKQVKDAGIDFAIIRLGFRGYGEEGKLVIDSRFEENYENATKEGIEIGVYFFSQAISKEEAKEEAELVIENIKNKDIKYPVAYDLERIKNNNSARTNNLTIEEKTDFAIEFCDTIEKAGYKSIIYGCSKSFTKEMALERLNEYNKWFADYQDKPLYPYDFDMWQYTEKGRINGISTNVDIDLYLIKK